MSRRDARSKTGIGRRASRYLAMAAREAGAWYDAAGHWRLASTPPAYRERLWLSFALFAQGDARLANAVCRPLDTPRFGRRRFNIFDTNIAALLLVEHASRMAPDVRGALTQLVRDGFSFRPGNRQPDYQFHGFNDNMPAKATMGLILGGERLRQREAVAYGLWNLRQLAAQLARRGINSEFNSPTYTPLTLHAMAAIAEHARSAEARHLALAIEERLWLDIASRFHPQLGSVVGPYSRAYTVDALGHISILSSLLWFVLGPRIPATPLALFERPAGLVVHHQGDYPFNIAQMCWLAAGHYHVPPAARRLFTRRRLPARSVATYESGDGGLDFPSRPGRAETGLFPDYGLGTCQGGFLSGEVTLHYHVLYRHRAPVRSVLDIGAVYHKLVVDDSAPGIVVQVPAPTSASRRAPNRGAVQQGEADIQPSHAHTLAVQDGPTALVLDNPHLALGGAPDTGKGARPIRRLSDLVTFSLHGGACEELLVGGRARRAWSGAVADGDWIACRRGRLLIAIRPLAYTRLPGKPRVTLERVNHYEVVRLALYDGPARRFTRGELRHVFGGFVAEHASVDEFPSLAAFARVCARARLSDYFWSTRRVRYARPACRWRAALDLEVSWSPGTTTPRYAMVNGAPVEWPAASLGGVPASRLPLLSQPPAPGAPFFPWKDFRVAWGDWPYAIHAREAPPSKEIEP